MLEGCDVPSPPDCSGLPGRTTLRQSADMCRLRADLYALFRSSRPDYIETQLFIEALDMGPHCSGLPGRTTLRHQSLVLLNNVTTNCSGLPGRTTLRPLQDVLEHYHFIVLFRSSRPDYIETRLQYMLYKTRYSYCSGLPGRTTLRLWLYSA